MVDMYILLIPLLWTSVISCPFEKFEPIHMYYNGASQMMCIEFDIVLQNSYSDFAIVQNGNRTIRATFITEDLIERDIYLPTYDRCWSNPMTYSGLTKDNILCVKYPFNTLPREIKSISMGFDVLTGPFPDTLSTQCSVSHGPHIVLPIKNIAKRNTNNICSKCEKCVPSCKLLIDGMGSYLCDENMIHLQVPTLLSRQQSRLLHLVSYKYTTSVGVIWCMEFTITPEDYIDSMDMTVTGYDSNGISIFIRQACNPIEAMGMPVKLCFFTHTNDILDHVKIHKMTLYSRSHNTVIKNVVLDLKDTQIYENSLARIDPCLTMACEKWIHSNDTCYLHDITPVTDAGKSILFTIIFIITMLLILLFVMCVARYTLMEKVKEIGFYNR